MSLINLNTIAHHALVSLETGEIFSKSAVLTEYFGFRDIFVHHETLLPRTRNASPHYHTLKEEMVIVLTGSPICHIEKQQIKMKAGDVIGFTPRLSKTHFIENPTSEIVQLLVICSNPQNDGVMYG